MDPEHKHRLQIAWAQLLETVGNVIGVVDGLFAKKVITRAMKERIMQGHTVDSDKLRALMDLLPKRGPEAFDAFYDVLIEQGEFEAADVLKPELRDKHKALSPPHPAVGIQETAVSLIIDDDLPEKWPDPSVHDPVRTKVVPVTEEGMRQNFANALAGSKSIFPLWRKTRGIFLLIDNNNFKDARTAGLDLGDRDGTNFDRLALDMLFRQLDFDVIVEKDCKAQEIADAVQREAGKSHLNFDCFVCAILTHGERDIIYGVDGNKLLLDEIIAFVDGEKCPTLIDKPKIFFIQACQGKKKDKGAGMVEQSSAAGDKPADDSISNIISRVINLRMQTEQHDAELEKRTGTKSDIFLAMATVPDFVSWRNTNHGTWFIQAVVFIFSTLCHKYDLLSLMTKVNNLVSRAETKEERYKQVSEFKSSLTKTFYFFPGLTKEVSSQLMTSSSDGRQTAHVHPQQPQQPEDTSSSVMY